MAKVTPPAEQPPLTDAEAEEYARRFEEARAVDFKPSERRRGRPPLGADYPSPRIQVRVSTAAFDALVERANEEGTTLSQLVRRLLESASEAKRA